MKLPKLIDYDGMQIKIGDEIYQFKVAKKVNDHVTHGTCQQETKQIRLAAWQGPVIGFYTLIHEILHAIEKEYDCAIPHHKLARFENGIADLLLQNGMIEFTAEVDCDDE